MGAVHQKVLEPVLAKIKYPTTLVLPDTREGTFELAPMWWVLGGDRRDESLNWLSALKFLLYLISEKRGLLKVRFWPHVLSAVMLTTEVRQQLRLSTVSNECDREKFWWKANVKICDFRSLFLNTECTRYVLLVTLKLHRLFLPCLVQPIGLAELNCLGVIEQETTTELSW